MKSPTLIIGLVLASACCLAGPPDKPDIAKEMKDGPLAPLIYPGATVLAGGAGGGGRGSGMTSAGHSVCLRTADSFEAVSAFYAKMLFPKDEDEVNKHGFRILASKPPDGISLGEGGLGSGGSGKGGSSGLGSGGQKGPSRWQCSTLTGTTVRKRSRRRWSSLGVTTRNGPISTSSRTSSPPLAQTTRNPSLPPVRPGDDAPRSAVHSEADDGRGGRRRGRCLVGCLRSRTKRDRRARAVSEDTLKDRVCPARLPIVSRGVSARDPAWRSPCRRSGESVGCP